MSDNLTGKHGTSINAGRRGVTYVATLPDGKRVFKQSFQVDAPEAFLATYQKPGGEWDPVMIVAEAQDGHPVYNRHVFVTQTAVAARRVS